MSLHLPLLTGNVQGIPYLWKRHHFRTKECVLLNNMHDTKIKTDSTIRMEAGVDVLVRE